jgi:hypothetical protein
MIANIYHILKIIQEHFFTGFGLISLLYPLGFILPRTANKVAVNRRCCYFMVFLGMVYLVLWLLAIAGVLLTPKELDSALMIDKMFGSYWSGFWLQPLVWIGATQLLRWSAFRYRTSLRILLGIVFSISFERFIFLLTAIHRDYIGLDASIWLDFKSWVISRFFSVCVFLCMTRIYAETYAYLKRMRQDLKWEFR